MNTIEAIDYRISELESEIEALDARIDATEDDISAAMCEVLEANKERLEAILEPLAEFSAAATRSGVNSDAIDAALDYAAGDLDRAAELIRYGVQEYSSAYAYGEQLFEGCYGHRELDGIISYIDFEAFGTDALMDVEYHEYNGGIYIFNT